MRINEAHRENLDTIILAASRGHLALMDCLDRTTGKPCVVLVAIGEVFGEVEITPLARMFDGNPYDDLSPPDPNGGYMQEPA